MAIFLMINPSSVGMRAALLVGGDWAGQWLTAQNHVLPLVPHPWFGQDGLLKVEVPTGI